MPAAGLGDLEMLVLLAVLRLAQQAYAVSVREEIAGRTGREVTRGAVYVTLDRMEDKGLLQSRLGEPTAARGGKAKRLYAVTPAGLAALKATLDGTRALMAGLPPGLLDGGGAQ
jgi:PadR family transcriptional regulator, regulatory protein PadR